MVAIINLIKALYRKMSGFEIHSDDIETAVTSIYRFLTEAALGSLDDFTNRLNTSKNGLSN
jgi:hypothetical protein